MTRVEIAREDREFSLLCKGHAGYANMGNDIVCAAISTLTQTLIKYLLDANIESNFHAESGFLWVYGMGEDAIKALDLVQTGLELIEMSYPHYVEIDQGCTIFREKPLS